MKLYVHKLWLINIWPSHLCLKYVYHFMIINDDFWKVSMQYDVISCVICIWNEVEYLEEEPSYKLKFYQRSYILILSDLSMEANRQIFVA
jgi:hypothetical protein